MTNVTITLDEQTVTWAREHAAERNMSLSRFVGEVLRERMRHSREYEEAYRAWRTERPFNLKGRWKPYPTREHLCDRPVLRRR